MGSKAPLMWILGEVWGSGRGTGSTCSFLSPRPFARFCFAFRQVYLLDNTKPGLTKTKMIAKKKKKVFSDLLGADTTFTSNPLLRNHGDSSQLKVQTPAGNAPTAAQTLSLTANRRAEGGTFRRCPCNCTLKSNQRLRVARGEWVPTAFPASGIRSKSINLVYIIPVRFRQMQFSPSDFLREQMLFCCCTFSNRISERSSLCMQAVKPGQQDSGGDAKGALTTAACKINVSVEVILWKFFFLLHQIILAIGAPRGCTLSEWQKRRYKSRLLCFQYDAVGVILVINTISSFLPLGLWRQTQIKAKNKKR